jgi:hypothetical protein
MDLQGVSLPSEVRFDLGAPPKRARIDPTTLGQLIYPHIEGTKDVNQAARRSKAFVLRAVPRPEIFERTL